MLDELDRRGLEALLGSHADGSEFRDWAGCERSRVGYWLLDFVSGQVVPHRCKSPNKCDPCAKHKAAENAEMIALDALEAPDRAPEIWAVLTTRTATHDMARFYDGLRKVKRALGREFDGTAYACVIEYTTGYGTRSGGDRRPHWNLLLKGISASELDRAAGVIRYQWCAHVDAEPQAQSVDPVWSHGGLLGYLAGHVQKASQKPPPGWRGQRFNCSRDYFEGRTRAEMRVAAREAIAWRTLMWRAGQQGLDGEAARAWANAERARLAAIGWLPVHITGDGRIKPLTGRPQPRTNTDDGGSFNSPLEAHLRMRIQPPSPDAVKYARAHDLDVDQLRWCSYCGIVAPAIDAYQRQELDRLGFADGLCPNCRAEVQQAFEDYRNERLAEWQSSV